MNLNKYLFTPGPVKMSSDILEIGSRQTPYFRNDEFSNVLLECEQNLLKISNAPKDSRVVFLTASGTAAMEACIQNLLSSEDKALVVNGGGFGQRFVDICNAQDIENINFKIKNDNLSDTSNIEIDKDVNVFLINAHETSIGHLYDMDSIGAFCKKNNLLNIVDAISMFVTDKLDMRSQNIDALILSSHKGLALPPGLAFVILSPKAIGRLKEIKSLYFNFKNYLSDGERGQTPYTPAVTIVLQLQKRLQNILKNGLKNEINHTKSMAEYFRKNITHLPLKPFSFYMPNAMTTLEITDDKKATKIVSDLEDIYDVVVCPNGGDLKEKIFRVSHMGEMDTEYIDVLLDALNDYYGANK